jgi:hypothetical protein
MKGDLESRLGMAGVHWFFADAPFGTTPSGDDAIRVTVDGEARTATLSYRPIATFGPEDVTVLRWKPSDVGAPARLRVQFRDAAGNIVAPRARWALRCTDPRGSAFVEAEATSDPGILGFERIPPGRSFRLACTEPSWLSSLVDPRLVFEFRPSETRSVDFHEPEVPRARVAVDVRDSMGRVITDAIVSFRYGPLGFVSLRPEMPAEPCRVFVGAFGYESTTLDVDLRGIEEYTLRAVLVPQSKGRLTLSPFQ